MVANRPQASQSVVMADGWRFGVVSLIPPPYARYFSSSLEGDGQGAHGAALCPKPTRGSLSPLAPVSPQRTPDAQP